MTILSLLRNLRRKKEVYVVSIVLCILCVCVCVSVMIVQCRRHYCTPPPRRRTQAASDAIPSIHPSIHRHRHRVDLRIAEGVACADARSLRPFVVEEIMIIVKKKKGPFQGRTLFLFIFFFKDCLYRLVVV